MPYKNADDKRDYERRYYTSHPQRAKSRRKLSDSHPVKPRKQRRTNGLPPNMPTFVALDGEGMDVNDGEHIYTLLASSSGAYVERWSGHGLSSKKCLDFILSEKRQGVILVGYAFNYDVNMLLKDVPQKALLSLWNMGECFVKLSGVYYKLSYIPSKSFTVARLKSFEKREDGKYVYTIEKSARVWDVFGFYQKSFVATLQEWCGDMASVIEYIASMKARRGQFVKESNDEIKTYCLNECELLVLVMDKLASALWQANIYLTSWHGAGSIAGTLLHQHHIEEHLSFETWSQSVRDASMWAYFGGRIEVFRQGIIPAPTFDYDVVSAYPSAIVDLPSLSDGEWFITHTYQSGLRYSLWHVSWNIPKNDNLFWLSPFPQHIHNGGVYYLSRGDGWYHGIEVDAAKAIYGDRITIDTGYVFQPKDESNKPFRWVDDIFRQRLEYKRLNDPRHYPLKVGLNSLYGKMAQGVSKNQSIAPRYQNYYLAGLITATTRARLLQAAHLAGKYHLIALATDGVFTSREIPVSVDPQSLGGWELSIVDEPLLVVQAGVMFTPSAKIVRSRGFARATLDYETLANVWRDEGYKGSLTYTERRFIGLGSAVGRRDFIQWRRWIENERLLNFSLGNKKLPDFSRPKGYVLPGVAYTGNRPYTPKRNVATAGEYDNYLQMIEDLDQPDYPD